MKVHYITERWCGLDIEIRVTVEPRYDSPRATEDCTQGSTEGEIVEVRYAHVGDFLCEYHDDPKGLAERWLPECPVAGALVHPRVMAWLAPYADDIVLDAIENSAEVGR